jgi:hypothetical protein
VPPKSSEITAPEQTAAPTRKKGGRKKGDGGRNDPEKNPMPRQRELQEKAFDFSVEGHSARWIAKELKITLATASKYIRIEERRHAAALAENRDQQTARSIRCYESIKTRAFRKAAISEDILEKIKGGAPAKLSEHYLDTAIKAQERIDRIRGVDAPLKIDAGYEKLVDALNARREGE